MSQALTSVTPVLSSKVGYLSDVNEQISTVVRFIIMNPGWISSCWENKLVSFRKLAAKYEKERSEFASQLSGAVQNLLSSKFRNYQFDCTFKTSDYDGSQADGRYTIGFNILIYPPTSVNSAEPGLVSGSIFVNPTDDTIVLRYDNETNIFTL